jgi:hypothetical protein
VVPPEVTVVYPNGGEVIAIGDTIDIQWVATDNRNVDSVSIYYSVDAGGDFTVITDGQPNDSLYKWIAPPVESELCLVKIIAYDSALLVGEDISDDVFTIVDQLGGAPDTTKFIDALGKSYPNPFSVSTRIPYSLKRSGVVSLAVYDASGRLVDVLYEGRARAGPNQVVWHGRDKDGRAVASGVYFCRIVTDSFTKTNKIVLLR